jgi:hypothetical protein
MRAFALAVACLFAAVTAGCAALQPGADELATVDRIAGEALSAAIAPLAEQKSALGRAQATFAQDPGAANRLRLATLLAALPAPLRDDARALELLEPMASASTPGYGRYAALLSANIGERQRLARELERVTRESERQAREHERSDKERAQREAELRQQLDALRAIERGILEREDKLRSRPLKRP